MTTNIYTYQCIFTASNDPTVEEINREAKSGWQVIQVGHREGAPNQFVYLMQKLIAVIEPVPPSTDIFIGTFTVGTTENRIIIGSHGLVNGAQVRFALGTEPNNALPAPLVVNVYYYVVGVRGNDFQVSLTSGGAVIDITNQGVGGTNQVWKK